MSGASDVMSFGISLFIAGTSDGDIVGGWGIDGADWAGVIEGGEGIAGMEGMEGIAGTEGIEGIAGMEGIEGNALMVLVSSLSDKGR